MGTIISLTLADMTLDWSKNSTGLDHGSLFQEQDRRRVHSDQINYDYYDANTEETPSDMAFVRTLNDILPRLELLGFTRERARREYGLVVQTSREYMQSSSLYDEIPEPSFIDFDEFCAFVARYSVVELDDTYVKNRDFESIKGRFANDPIIDRIPNSWSTNNESYSERSYFGNLIGIIHPYSLMWVLAENDKNRQSDIVWDYGPLAGNGWANESDFVPCARRRETFLIATEGSSDTHILKHAFSMLRPDIADFFRFIDVSERHPFSGTGNLIKFAEGLAKIDVQNQIVFLLDNDSEGYQAYERVQRLSLPANMKAVVLPDLEDFCTFPARGPEGINTADINRRAAAIECYLDLNLNGRPAPQVVWTIYKEELDDYHGVLEHKETYTKKFLQQTASTIQKGCYDDRKIRVVLDKILMECSAIAGNATVEDRYFE